jgi:uncharacterized protein with GYD domain
MFASFARRALSSSSSSPLSCCSSSRSIASTTINGVSAGNLLRQTNDPLGAEAEELAFAPNKSKHNQLFAPSDPIFMSQFLYDSEFIKKQMREITNSSSSQNVSGEKECAKMLAQIGGTMKSYYKATTGEYDGVVIYSFPKNHDVHTFEQIVKSSGLIEKVYTTKLMTSEDSDVALRAAKELVDKYGGGSAGL